MSFFNSVDLFSYRFGFHHKKRTEFKTAIGGILSILIVTYLGIISYLTAGNFIYKKNPKISVKDDVLESLAGIPLSQNTVIIAFLVEGLTSKDIFPNNLFKMEVVYYDDFTNLRTTIVDNSFELVPCRNISGYTYENIVKKNVELYVNGICLKFPPGKQYDLKNSLINISFYCHSYSDTNCMYDETFKTKVLDKSVTLYYLGLNVDIDELENVFNNQLESFGVVLNPMLSTKADLFYEFTKVESDVGILSEILIETTTISANSYTFNNIFNYKLNSGLNKYRDTIKLFNLDVYVKNNRKTFRRIYYKLQNLFAELGGIINISLIIGKLIVYMYNKKSFESDLLNEVFNIEDIIKLKIPDYDRESFQKNSNSKNNVRNTKNNISIYSNIQGISNLIFI